MTTVESQQLFALFEVRNIPTRPVQMTPLLLLREQNYTAHVRLFSLFSSILTGTSKTCCCRKNRENATRQPFWHVSGASGRTISFSRTCATRFHAQHSSCHPTSRCAPSGWQHTVASVRESRSPERIRGAPHARQAIPSINFTREYALYRMRLRQSARIRRRGRDLLTNILSRHWSRAVWTPHQSTRRDNDERTNCHRFMRLWTNLSRITADAERVRRGERSS